MHDLYRHKQSKNTNKYIIYNIYTYRTNLKTIKVNRIKIKIFLTLFVNSLQF